MFRRTRGPASRRLPGVPFLVVLLVVIGLAGVLEAGIVSLLLGACLPALLAVPLSALIIIIPAFAIAVIIARWLRLETPALAVIPQPEGPTDRLARLHQVVVHGREGGSDRLALGRVVDEVRRVLDATYAALVVLDASGRVADLVSVAPGPDERLRFDQSMRELGLLALVERSAAAVSVDDVRDDPRLDRFVASPSPIISFCGVAVVAASERLGLLCAANKLDRSGRVVPFGLECIDTLTLAAGEAALALAGPASGPLIGAPGGAEGSAAEVERVLRVERERIGMDLHDGVIQSLYALGLGLEAAIQALETDVPLARSRLIQSRDTINNVMQEIRQYIVSLRSQAGAPPLLAARLRAAGEELGLNVHVDVAPEVEQSLTAQQRQQVFLIAREALINAAKHARANQVVVSLRPQRNGWALRVQDDGVGFVPGQVNPTSFGLQSMRERARLLGGKLTINSRPNQGTEVRLTVSLPPEEPPVG